MYTTLRSEILTTYAGDPEAIEEALAQLDDNLASSSPRRGRVVALHDPGREAAWNQLGA